MNYAEIAKKLLEKVGGKENVISLVHCMTRLRFELNDLSKVDEASIKKMKGVVTVIKKSGQFQVVIGNEVGYVYEELAKLGDFAKATQPKNQKPKEKQKLVPLIMDTISSIMAPVIPAIIGAAMIKVLLTLLPMMGILDQASQTYELLNVIGDGAFFFMPVLIAMSAANRFQTNPYYAVSIALVMLHPRFISMMQDAQASGEVLKFFDFIPVTYASYAYSVIPIILSVGVLATVEKVVDRITPVFTKNFLKPMLVILIMLPIALVVLGPLGAILGELLASGIYGIYNTLGFVAIGLLAGVFPFIVMAGMHHAFTPIKIGMLGTVGYEAFIAIAELASNLAQGGSALAVAVKSKNKDFKQVAASSAFSAIVAGITEPALYGVNVRLKKPMLGACIGAIIGGLFGGLMQMKCFGVASPSLVTVAQYVEQNRLSSFFIALGMMGISVVASFIATYIIGFEDVVYEEDEAQEDYQVSALTDDVHKITSPLKGEVHPLATVKDETFAQEILGKGVAVLPKEGKIYAPFDGVITTFFNTGHAIGLKSQSGVELLIHVGIDTVNLEGKYFTPHKQTNDVIKKGDLLLDFDIEGIQNEGYDSMTPIIICNADEYMDIVATQAQDVRVDDALLTAIRR